MDKKIIVIGGGPAGLLAAATAAAGGGQVVLVEKQPLLAQKLRITGKGRCNITNGEDISEFINKVRSNSSFLYSAFYTFTNTDTINLFHSLGVQTKEERGGRVFPQSDKAKDVAEALITHAKQRGVSIRQGTVDKLLLRQDRVCGVLLRDGSSLPGDAVIVATGGMSYHRTGSTGDGYRFAKQAGHTIVDAKPSLVPLETKEKWVADAMGLSLKNVTLSLLSPKGKVVYSELGEMLFTHFGVSGPLVLSASANMKEDAGQYRLAIDLKPALTMEALDARVQRDFAQLSNKNFSNALDDLLPKKLIPIIIDLSGIDENQKVHQITREERQRLVALLKQLPLAVTKTRPIEEAIITAGGVSTKEINPSTLESKRTAGLYFAGEVIDVDAYTGGYNLQIAFSTGFLAGQSSVSQSE